MDEFDPVQEAIKRNIRKRGYSFLIISIILILLGAAVIIFFGKLDFNWANHHSHFSRLRQLEEVFGAGVYGFFVLCFGLGFLIAAFISFLNSKASAIVPSIQSEKEINKMEKELKHSEEDLDQMIYDKMKKQGNNLIQEDEEEESRSSFLKRNRIEKVSDRMAHPEKYKYSGPNNTQ
jgi:hypothetical protein